MPRLRRLAVLAVATTALLAIAATANATISTRTIEYGPYTIPAGGGDPHEHDTMGQIANRIDSNVAKPCTNCDIIGVTPELVYTDGRKANLDTGPMLHHTLFAATGEGKADLVCRGTTVGFLGERFFAAGNERTAVDVTELPYGYAIGSSEQWNQVVDLMNWATESKTVKIRITWKYATGSDATSRTNVRPLWLDADGCSTDSLISVPEGRSDTHRDISAPIGGRVIGVAGHIHDHGINVELTNRSAGEALICNSIARYGETPDYITPDGRRHVSSMNVCRGNPLATIRSRDRLRLHTIYDVPVGHHPIDDAMGIMLAYVAP
jgi:Stress up-regulated Nod 19